MDNTNQAIENEVEKDEQDVANDVGTAPTDKQEEKKFTQAELDDTIKKRMARELKKFPSKDELEAFKQWKDEQTKSTEEEQTEPTENKRDDEVFALKSELALTKLGAKAEFIEFLTSKLDKMEGEDVVANAEKLKEENEQYFGTKEKKKAASAPRMGNTKVTNQTVNETVNNMFRRN